MPNGKLTAIRNHESDIRNRPLDGLIVTEILAPHKKLGATQHTSTGIKPANSQLAKVGIELLWVSDCHDVHSRVAPRTGQLERSKTIETAVVCQVEELLDYPIATRVLRTALTKLQGGMALKKLA